LEVVASSTHIPPDGVIDEPDHDFYHGSALLNDLVIFVLLLTVGYTSAALVLLGDGFNVFQFFRSITISNTDLWTPQLVAFGLLIFTIFVLFRLMIERLRIKWAGKFRTVNSLRVINFLCLLFLIFFPRWLLLQSCVSLFIAVIYVVICLLYKSYPRTNNSGVNLVY
jgi:hypothetical protein